MTVGTAAATYVLEQTLPASSTQPAQRYWLNVSSVLPVKTNKRMGASLFTLVDAEDVRAKMVDAATWSIVHMNSPYVENDSGAWVVACAL